MKNIILTINGKNVSCLPGTSILEAALSHGIKIPTLCYHQDLEPFGGCRLCLVEDEKSGRVMASCVTPATPNMSIRTDSPRVERHRRNIIRLMMAEHPESCLVCNKGNRCQLRETAAQLGVGLQELYPMPHYKPLEQANPFIIRDLSKCILCGKCIRADHELVAVGAIEFNLRGFRSRPTAVHDYPLEHSTCTFCGTCVSICPTGALAVKNTRYVGTPQRESLSICGFCGVGCTLSIGVAYERIVDVNPGNREGSVNGSTLCVRGHFANDFLNTVNRLTAPGIRKNGQMISVSWDEVIEFTANRLMEIKTKEGPQSVALLGSSKCTNEENYLFQKISRVLLKTNNIDNGGYLSGRSVMSLVNEKTGGGCRINQLESLEKAHVIFVLGADPTQSVPVVSYFIKRAVRKGIPLIVADPRKTELTNVATIWLRPRPNSDFELINALAALLLKKNAHNSSFIDRFTEGFSDYRDSLSSLDLEKVCRITGISLSSMDHAANLLKGKGIAFVVGHGIFQQRCGMESMEAVLNLSLMTGSLGREGAGLYLVTRENNEVGAWDMGTVPDMLPGRQPLNSDPAQRQWEQFWQTRISPDRGLNMVRMIEEAEKGNLKALYIMGENPLRSLPQPERVKRALERLEFLAVQDILDTETTRIAHVVLPGAAFSEKSGSFTNMEGRIQTFRSAVPPPGNARPDWEILDMLSNKLGYPGRYGSIEKLRSEICQFIPLYGDLKGNDDVAWIRETCQKSLFHPDGKGDLISFSPVVSRAEEVSDKEYPFTAISGSLRYHLGSGTRTSHSDRIRDFTLRGEIEISPEDAGELSMHDGDLVRVLSRLGSIEREITLVKGVKPGTVFIPAAFNGNDAMRLIGLASWGKPGSPGLKHCLVNLERV